MSDQQGSPTPSQTGHLTPERLDELALAPDLADHEPHLTGCTRCQEALADQHAVRRVLQSVPDPGPMPADVVARLESALAGATSAHPTAPATVVPLDSTRRRSGALARLAESRITKSLVAAAAVGLIGVGGYAAINRNQQTSTAGGASASSAGDSQGGAPKAVQTLQSVRAQESGTAYTKANVAAQVTLRLTPEASGDAAGGGATFAARTQLLATTAGLQGCLQALEASTAIPQLVDLATFDGKPAAILVLPRLGGGRELWVVSRTCAPGHDGTLYYALLK